MRIVITTTLNNNLLYAKLAPLAKAQPNTQIVVVTDLHGPDIDNIQWVWPKGKLAKLGHLPGRILLLLREVIRPETKLLMAYSLVPHGLFAVLFGKLFRKPVFLHFIAGPAELNFAHDIRVTDNRLLAKTNFPEIWEQIGLRFSLWADAIFVPGQQTEESIVSQGIERNKCIRLHSTVDTQRYFPLLYEDRSIDIVVCAQLRERKRPLFTACSKETVGKHRFW